ncbi:hypothetical protein AZI86_06980 [Bdellovibrio bacteriovorus]|uniref:Uncharacterized protein n=1 Tax=Bdellovibrio bacteriovorus TaxID=959 RepID=A0A150WR50_BDEBC|nr:hypothetical protein [Bdellovibrio bacteriovorus]KYG66779.1 hypothetical protein AZI86_06980 [Bdellovibrio bacteriovorus]
MIRNALIAVYIIAVLAISAVARAGVLPNNAQDYETANTDLQNYNYKTHVGEVVALADGSLVLAMDDQQTFFVLKSQMDLTPFVGSKVMMSGIELEHHLAPNIGYEVVDPLPGFDSESKSVIFFVFGIKEITQ